MSQRFTGTWYTELHYTHICISVGVYIQMYIHIYIYIYVLTQTDKLVTKRMITSQCYQRQHSSNLQACMLRFVPCIPPLSRNQTFASGWHAKHHVNLLLPPGTNRFHPPLLSQHDERMQILRLECSRQKCGFQFSLS
jgi:hypothetical protein